MQKDREYIYSLRKYILASTGIFVFSLLIGVLVSALNPQASERLFEMLKEAFSRITTLDPFERMLEIFKNNVRNSLMALVLGIIFGIVPFVIAASNGLVLGMLAETVSRQQGVLFVVAALLPHGIIELPMVLVSVGIGLRLGHAVYLLLKGMRIDITQELIQGMWFYVRWIVPLLLVAAVIESYLTPLVASRFIS